MLTSYHPELKEFEETNPSRFRKRFVVAEDDSFRSGYSSWEPHTVVERFIWWDEFFVTLKGRATLKGDFPVPAAEPPTRRSVELEVGPEDTLFMGKGSQMRIEVVSDEPWLFFYIAVPASGKGLHYKMFPPSKPFP